MWRDPACALAEGTAKFIIFGALFFGSFWACKRNELECEVKSHVQ